MLISSNVTDILIYLSGDYFLALKSNSQDVVSEGFAFRVFEIQAADRLDGIQAVTDFRVGRNSVDFVGLGIRHAGNLINEKGIISCLTITRTHFT